MRGVSVRSGSQTEEGWTAELHAEEENLASHVYKTLITSRFVTKSFKRTAKQMKDTKVIMKNTVRPMAVVLNVISTDWYLTRFCRRGVQILSTETLITTFLERAQSP